MNKEELHQLLHPMKVIGLGGNPDSEEVNNEQGRTSSIIAPNESYWLRW